MVQIRTSPQETSSIVLEARKSCSFGINVVSKNEAAIDLTGSSIILGVSKRRRGTHDAPLLRVNATLSDEQGWAYFALQASQLDLEPGTYDFDILMLLEGYSVIIVKGELEVVNNTDVQAVSSIYTAPASTLNLKVLFDRTGYVKVVVADIPMPVPGGGGGGGDPLSDAGVAALIVSGTITRPALNGIIDERIVAAGPGATDDQILSILQGATASRAEVQEIAEVESDAALAAWIAGGFDAAVAANVSNAAKATSTAVATKASQTINDAYLASAVGTGTFKTAVEALINSAVSAAVAPLAPKSQVYAVRRRTTGGTGQWEAADRTGYAGIIWIGSDPSPTDQAAGDIRYIPED